MRSLRGAKVVITGGSSGIGEACGQAFHAVGSQVTIVAGDAERLAVSARRLGVHMHQTDLADSRQARALARWLADDLVPDVLVHAAGVGWFGSCQDDDAASVRRLMDVNVISPMLLTAGALPGMLRNGHGHLVFVGSIAGQLGVGKESVYAASKAALATYATSVRLELGGRGIGVTTVIPGVVATGFFDRRGAPYGRRFPRPVPPERVAGAVLDGVRRDRAEVVVPRWLRLPIAVRSLAPQVYTDLAARWG